jgi:hypothetical protein
MEKSNIYKKLLAFQKLGISVKKDGQNPHFKSHYATLNEVLDKVKKPLNDLGVLILFLPNETGLVTRLYDTESDTEINGFMQYVGADNAQKLLACNTYFRRGSLVSLLGLEDEDNDGEDVVRKQTPPATHVKETPKTIPDKKFVLEPIEKIKATSNKGDLVILWNSLHPSQQSTEHILDAFKKQSKTFKTK